MRSTHPFEQEEVMAYLDGEVAADRASEIAQHMQKCAECQALAATFRNLSRDLSAWEIEASPARLNEQMNAEIAAGAVRSKQTASSPAELTPFKHLTKFLSTLKQRPWVWAGMGALATVMVMVISLPTLRSRPVPQLAAREVGLRAQQQRTEREKVASSLENKPVNGRSTTVLVQLEPGVASSSPQPASAGGAPSSPLIARTASLSLVVKNFTGIEAAVKIVVSGHSGYIGELNTATPPDAAKTFSAILRVPSGQLEPALAELKQLGRVDQGSQSGEEVTKQYVDLAARLKNSRATEERLLGVLRSNTGKVKDVLEVENEIARVRGEIEEMEADQRALQSRVDFATITLSVTEEYKASLNAPSSSVRTRLHNAFVAGYHSVVDNVIGVLAWLLESGPTLLLWAALLFFPLRWAWRRVRRVFDRAPKPVIA